MKPRGDNETSRLVRCVQNAPDFLGKKGFWFYGPKVVGIYFCPPRVHVDASLANDKRIRAEDIKPLSFGSVDPETLSREFLHVASRLNIYPIKIYPIKPAFCGLILILRAQNYAD